MNRTQIRAKARKNLGEITASFWDDTELNDYIENACDDLAERAKCIKANGYMDTVADQAEHVLSTEFPTLLSVLKVYLKQSGVSYEKLTSTTADDLDIESPGWKSADAGTPSKYYWDKEEDMIGFYPKPDSDNAGTDYAQVYYSRTHTDIASDISAIDIPEALHEAIVDFVVATGVYQRGYGDKANDMWGKYFSKIHDYQVEIKRAREDDTIIMKNYKNL